MFHPVLSRRFFPFCDALGGGSLPLRVYFGYASIRRAPLFDPALQAAFETPVRGAWRFGNLTMPDGYAN